MPTLFNMVVGNVVHNWFFLMVEYGPLIHNGLGQTVGQILGLFYTDDGLLVSRGLYQLQGALNFLIGLLR